MVMPANVDTGRVEGRFIVGVADGPDADSEPDAIPAQGTITFTASVPYLPNPTSTPSPSTLLKVPIVSVLDGEGYLCTPDPNDPTKPGARGIRLVATDDPDLSVQEWTWTVTYSFQTVNGVRPQIASHSMFLPSDTVVDLTSVVKVPSSTGIGTEQAEALAAAAQVAAAEASAAALAASEAAQATDSGVAGLVVSGGDTTTALDTGYRRDRSVREFGALGDGIADDTAAIQAAINAASADESRVFFPGGRYRITSTVNLPTRTVMHGEGRSSIIDITGLGSTGTAPKTAFEGTGTLAAAKNIAGTVAKGAKTVEMTTSLHELGAGDYVILQSDDLFAASTVLRRGETKRIESVDGATIEFEDSTYDEYVTAPRLQKVTPVEGIYISDLTFEGTPTDNMERGVFITYGVDIQVHRCTFNYTDWNSVNLRSVTNFKVTGNTFRNVKWISNNPNYYGLVVENASSHGVFSGNHGTLCRHLFTTGYTGSIPGATRFVVVEGNVDSYSQSASFDTHDGSEHIIVRGNTSSYSAAGGINMEGRENTIEGNRIVGFTTTGILLRASAANTLVRGNRLTTSAAGVAGISVRKGGADSPRPVGIHISGNIVDGPMPNGIVVLDADDISIQDNTFPEAWISYVIRMTGTIGGRIAGNSCGSSGSGFLYLQDTQNIIAANNDCGATYFGVRGGGAQVNTLITGNDFTRVTDARKVYNLTGERRYAANLGLADEAAS